MSRFTKRMTGSVKPRKASKYYLYGVVLKLKTPQAGQKPFLVEGFAKSKEAAAKKAVRENSLKGYPLVATQVRVDKRHWLDQPTRFKHYG